MVSGCSSLVRYLLHSIACLHLKRKMKTLSRGALSSAFTSGQSMPWFHSDQLSRLQCPPARGGNEALFVGSRKDSPFGSNTQSAVRSPQSAVRSPQSAVRSSPSAVRSPQSAVRSLQSAVRSPQSTFYNSQSAVCSPQSAVHSPQFAVRSPHSAVFVLY